MRVESKKETTYTYKVEDSASRMDDILDVNDNDYEDNKNDIPSRNKLTYKRRQSVRKIVDATMKSYPQERIGKIINVTIRLKNSFIEFDFYKKYLNILIIFIISINNQFIIFNIIFI